MKRAFVNLNQSPVVDDDEAKAKIKHQTLLQEYLQLRKEVVSKKRKLQTIKQKRKNLLGVVRFLRQKRRCLLKNQSVKHECEEGFVQPQDPNMPTKMLERERNQCANEGREQNGEQPLPPLRIEKSSSTNRLINDRRLVKKKVSWLDEMPLKI